VCTVDGRQTQRGSACRYDSLGFLVDIIVQISSTTQLLFYVVYIFLKKSLNFTDAFYRNL